ncbi:MAG: phosphopantetheine-binding protein [Oscillospiraceae bacterium]|nr:phosphopantetheine-binding protein [Oscillospiraceae bacterium]
MLDKITTILREYKDDDSLTVTETTTFESLELDSLDLVELVMSLEETFSVTIEMSESIKTVGNLMATIQAVQTQ